MVRILGVVCVTDEVGEVGGVEGLPVVELHQRLQLFRLLLEGSVAEQVLFVGREVLQ